MKLQLKKNDQISIESFVNDRLITDRSWEVWSCDNPDGGMTILLKEPNSGQNSVKIIVNKCTESTEIK